MMMMIAMINHFVQEPTLIDSPLVLQLLQLRQHVFLRLFFFIFFFI